MRLDSLTRDQIRAFAGAKIFERGEEYLTSELVNELDIDSEGIVTAKVEGTDTYEVEVWEEEDDVGAVCDCPYDGHPCKHVAAVLLAYLDHSAKQRKAKTKQPKAKESASGGKSAGSLKANLKRCTHTELVELVLEGTKGNKDFERKLMLRFVPDSKKTLTTLLQQVKTVRLKVSEYENYYSSSCRKAAREFKAILKVLTDAPPEVRVEVRFAVADRILPFLNEYGFSNEPLETALELALAELVKDVATPEFQPQRDQIIQWMRRYHDKGNHGMTDELLACLLELSATEEELRDTIHWLEKKGSWSSYYRKLIAELYAKLGDEEAELAALSKNLEGMPDHWRLAEFWTKQGATDKALKTCWDGVQRGKGYSEELFAFLREDCLRRDDAEGLFTLLVEHLKRPYGGWHVEQLSASRRMLYRESSSSGDFLQEHELLRDRLHKQGDTAGLVRLYTLYLNPLKVSLSLYQEMEHLLPEPERGAITEKVLGHLKQKIGKDTWGSSPERRLLAEIYAHGKHWDALLDLVKNDFDLLAHYKDRLAPLHPHVYLEAYTKEVEKLINGRGRSNYRAAAEHLLEIREFYERHLNQSRKWLVYLEELKRANLKLRALHEELGKVRL